MSGSARLGCAAVVLALTSMAAIRAMTQGAGRGAGEASWSETESACATLRSSSKRASSSRARACRAAWAEREAARARSSSSASCAALRRAASACSCAVARLKACASASSSFSLAAAAMAAACAPACSSACRRARMRGSTPFSASCFIERRVRIGVGTSRKAVLEQCTFDGLGTNMAWLQTRGTRGTDHEVSEGDGILCLAMGCREVCDSTLELGLKICTRRMVSTDDKPCKHRQRCRGQTFVEKVARRKRFEDCFIRQPLPRLGADKILCVPCCNMLKPVRPVHANFGVNVSAFLSALRCFRLSRTDRKLPGESREAHVSVCTLGRSTTSLKGARQQGHADRNPLSICKPCLSA
eukprot:111282-Rhodomonas_salina.2